MSTKTHDELIKESIRWAESLGYKVVDYNLGMKTGADAIFQNHAGEMALLEIVTGASFIKLFKKQRIKEALENKFFVGLIVVGDRINKLKDHGIKAGFSGELFEPGNKHQKVFSVLVRDFNPTIPVLLLSILGTKGSPNRAMIH